MHTFILGWVKRIVIYIGKKTEMVSMKPMVTLKSPLNSLTLKDGSHFKDLFQTRPS